MENSLLAVTWTRCCRYTERYLYMCPRKTLVSSSNSGRKGWPIFRSNMRSDSQPPRVPRLCASHQHRYRIGTIGSFEAKAHFCDAYPGSFHLHSNKRILSTSNCLCNVVFMHDQTNSTRLFPPNTRLSITRYLPAKPFHHLYTATTNTSTQNNCEQFRIAEKGHSSSILLPSVKRANFHEALTLSLFSGYKDRSSDTVFEFIYASGS